MKIITFKVAARYILLITAVIESISLIIAIINGSPFQKIIDKLNVLFIDLFGYYATNYIDDSAEKDDARRKIKLRK
ncbi:hypothetical protein [Xylocopilactobacillus apis]|uniref:Uncharacterized protein n=1 Tax=Xylocopilactobacillus apis TaxID=2932183 RepID=A0AAU9DP02_9LACO|nr:hypothetical protein [Xylocopilactobacillus apis]BDR56708.1 hypothetical protein KIMC2_12700 [Xylocopilactobacillus apis]